ncbi:MAG: hypothetical protein ACMXX7_01220 [Candidatus Woesearchaeota archaeon]
MKKGDLSISTIILIVLGVLVLVIILATMFRSSDGFNTATACAAEGGRCIDPFTFNCESNFIQDASCPVQGEQCCPVASVRSR